MFEYDFAIFKYLQCAYGSLTGHPLSAGHANKNINNLNQIKPFLKLTEPRKTEPSVIEHQW